MREAQALWNLCVPLLVEANYSLVILVVTVIFFYLNFQNRECYVFIRFFSVGYFISRSNIDEILKFKMLILTFRYFNKNANCVAY